MIVAFLSTLPLSHKTTRRLSLWMGGIVLLSLYMFKNPLIFPDLDVYKDFFETIVDNDGRIAPFSFQFLFEEGWVILTYICRRISDNFELVVFAVALCITLAITKTAQKYSAIVWMPVVLFLCIKFEPTLYILRQAVSMACVLFSLKHIKDRQLLPFLGWIIIGYFFHRSIIICLPLYYLANLELSAKNICITFLFAVIGLIGLNSILGFFSQYFYKLEVYSEGDVSISFVTWILPIASFVYCWICFKWNKVPIQGINQVFFWMLLLEIILTTYYYIGTSFDAFYRLNFYFALGKIFLMPNATALIKNVTIRRLAIICLCGCWMVYMTMTFPYGYKYIF